jgi:hypothetical protein
VPLTVTRASAEMPCHTSLGTIAGMPVTMRLYVSGCTVAPKYRMPPIALEASHSAGAVAARSTGNPARKGLLPSCRLASPKIRSQRPGAQEDGSLVSRYARAHGAAKAIDCCRCDAIADNTLSDAALPCGTLLLPFDRPWRLRGHVVDDAVDAANSGLLLAQPGNLLLLDKRDL